jgi:hypothetical protein
MPKRSASDSRVRARTPIVGLLIALGSGASSGATAQPVDTASARAGLLSFERACREDAGRLWGKTLCGRVILVDPASRTSVASQPDKAGRFRKDGTLWVGRLPDGIGLANTSLDWDGERWAMALLPLPNDAFEAVDLLAHESFHRIQDGLGLGGADALNPHLDSRDGRLWLRLELRALGYALTTTGVAARRHAEAAMRFRAERRRAFADADSLEDALELTEGLAEYTGHRIAGHGSNLGSLRTVHAMLEVERRPTLVRSFAYATGPALGLLLDRYDPGWRRRIARVRSMGGMLSAALGVTGEPPRGTVLTAMARPYGLAELSRQEDDRATARAATLARYRARLIDGPVLTMRQDGLMRSFNPNTLLPLDSSGTVYPTGTFSADWGTLEVSAGGAMVSKDFRLLRVPAPVAPDADAAQVVGDGWKLTLKAGWVIRAGGRAADFEVAKR